MNVLVVEDDKEICEALKVVLEPEGFNVQFVYNGLNALTAFEQQSPDVILLDWMLPGLDGLEVCNRIRATPQGSAPYILMLTARSQEIDKVIALSTGADDYIVKPFSSMELVARIRAVVRRSQRQGSSASQTNMLKSEHFTVDLDSHTAQQDGQELSLTTLEFSLLSTFLTHLNRVWTREQLIGRLWGDDFFGDERAVDNHIARLRKKIEENPAQPQYLVTVVGVGYKFVDTKAHGET
jgi:two-component system OmpR family response regulator